VRLTLPHDPDQVTEIDPRSHYSFVLTAHAAGGTSEPSVAAALPPDPNPSRNPNPNPSPCPDPNLNPSPSPDPHPNPNPNPNPNPSQVAAELQPAPVPLSFAALDDGDCVFGPGDRLVLR